MKTPSQRTIKSKTIGNMIKLKYKGNQANQLVLYRAPMFVKIQYLFINKRLLKKEQITDGFFLYFGENFHYEQKFVYRSTRSDRRW